MKNVLLKLTKLIIPSNCGDPSSYHINKSHNDFWHHMQQCEIKAKQYRSLSKTGKDSLMYNNILQSKERELRHKAEMAAMKKRVNTELAAKLNTDPTHSIAPQ